MLKSGNGGNFLLKTRVDDVSRKLSTGSKFSVAYAVEARVASNFRRGGISSHLGVLDVDWIPTPLQLPTEVLMNPLSAVGAIDAHGPLVLEKPSKIQFRGPPFYIESAPFAAKLSDMPSSPSIANPFDVSYQIENKTGLHQHLTIRMQPAGSEGLLLCGTTAGELNLGPNETLSLTYNMLATRPGLLFLPSLEVVSSRYRSWVIHDKKQEIYVLP